MMTAELGRKRHCSRSTVRACALVLVLVARGQAIGGERGPSDPGRQPFLERVQPVGGWHPDGGGLLHWWDPNCFPRCGAPNDYCRKPIPRRCWPAYPPSYIWVQSQTDYPGGER